MRESLTKALLLLITLLFLPIKHSKAQSTDTDDIVNWNDVTLILPLIKENDRLSMSFSGVLRIGRNLRRPIDERGSFSLAYRINKHFSTSIGYLYRRSRLTEQPSQFEHRLTFSLLTEKKLENIALKNRLTTFYQIRHSNSNLLIQQNRIQLSFPIKKGKEELFSPFIADGVFYNFQTKKLFRNDIFLGITKNFTKELSADFFYIRQNLSLGQIKETQGFGISLRIRIKE